ncbi:MAG: GNAT family N-acetyltransferase [Boseongicola sp.]
MTPAALPTLRKPRLTLRPLETTDSDAIVDGVGNFDVSKWLSVVPYPYSRSDADWFLEKTIESQAPVWAICDASGLQGLIGLEDELGYWLARTAWRKGYGFEAAHAVVAQWFTDPAADDLRSGHFEGNTRSGAVLSALGFQITGHATRNACALSQQVTATEMVLTRARWDERRKFTLYTPRLTLRPLELSDADHIVTLAVADVARQTGSFETGWSKEAAENYIKDRQWRGLPGFMLAVEHRGEFTGVVGCGGTPPSAMYALHPDHWGQGIATEAMSAFLPEVFDRFPLNTLVANHFEDNPASGRVLKKLGFTEIGRDTAESKARLEPTPAITYAVTRDTLRAWS